MRVALVFLIIIASGCASDRMHFRSYSEPDAKAAGLSEHLGNDFNYSNVVVLGGEYFSYGEYGDYSWHIYYSRHNRFYALPYRDPNDTIKHWFIEVMNENGVIKDSNSKNYLEVRVNKLKIKSQAIGWYNYRACLVGFDLAVKNQDGSTIDSFKANGIAKLPGHGIDPVSNAPRHTYALQPDDPSVCKLAIVKALNNL